MKRVVGLIAILSVALLSIDVSAYDPAGSSAGTGYNQTDIDEARDETVGGTQTLIEERSAGRPDFTLDCIACHAETDDDYEGVINSAEIMEQTLAADVSTCMDWEIVGACVWMTCIAVVCEFNTTVKVKNNVPDLVIQSYDRANGEPWTESQDLNQISQGDSDSSWVMRLIGMVESIDLSDIGTKGGISTQGHVNKHASLTFKLVDAYGSPGALEYMAANSTGYFCDGEAIPFFPYYISNLDSIAWRWNLPEVFYPMSWDVITGLWELGNRFSGNMYGGEYPRMGFSIGQDPAKAAVLTAHRAAHFITRSGQPHLYFDIAGDDEAGWWPPDPYVQNRSATGAWQMLYPMDENTCRKFPYSANPGASRRSDDGSYVWNFWREYKCCEEDGAVLIFHFG